jgi:hypothetical protein
MLRAKGTASHDVASLALAAGLVLMNRKPGLYLILQSCLPGQVKRLAETSGDCGS